MLSTVHVIVDGVDRRRHLPLFYSCYAHFLKVIIAFSLLFCAFSRLYRLHETG